MAGNEMKTVFFTSAEDESNVIGMGAVEAVTSHFRLTPPLIPRRRSPGIHPNQNASEGNLAPSMVTPVDDFERAKGDLSTMSFQEPVHDSVFAYLGEEPSVHDRIPQNRPRESYVQYNRISSQYPYIRRAVSLEWIQKNSQGENLHARPYMNPLPAFTADADVTYILSLVSVDDWVMPYVVAFLKDQVVEYFGTLPNLFDVKEYSAYDVASGQSNDDGAEAFTSDSYSSSNFGNAVNYSNTNTSTGSYDVFQGFDDISNNPSMSLHSEEITTRMRNRSNSEHNLQQPGHHRPPTQHPGYHHRPMPVYHHGLSTSPEIRFPSSSSPSPSPTLRPPRRRSPQLAVELSESSVTCLSLGLLYCSRDPSWDPWNMRLICLCDTYLYEVLAHGEDVVGYTPLSGASITRETITGHRNPTRSDHAIYEVLRVEYHLNSSNDSFLANRTGTVWLKPLLDEDLDILELVIRKASQLRVEDVYNFTRGSDEDILVGRGRFSEVRKARRRSVTFAPSQQTPLGTPTPPLRNGIAMSPNPSPSPILEPSFLDAHAAQCASNIALKIMSKEIFRERVTQGKERADAIVREVLAQATVCKYVSSLSQMQRNRIATREVGYETPSSNSRSRSATPPLLSQPSPIVEIFGVFETLDGFIVELELMQQSDLYEQLANQTSSSGSIPEDQVKQIMKQLVTAVMLCMRAGVAHRDVKLSNITIVAPQAETSYPFHSDDKSSKQPLHIKLADFGMAGFVSDQDKKVRGRCGTPGNRGFGEYVPCCILSVTFVGYVAPDILCAGINEGYDANVDMFSVGVVAYVLLCGYEPFYGDTDSGILQSNKLARYAFHEAEWRHISDDAKDWISRALLPRGSSRLRPEEALKHPWLHSTASHPIVGTHIVPAPTGSDRPPLPPTIQAVNRSELPVRKSSPKIDSPTPACLLS